MAESWKSLRQVPQDMLQERLQTVKELSGDENGTELYEIVKDRDTGEHYLHYAYLHWNAADGSKESFHHLLPLEHDDVLAILFGEQAYAYPEHWRKPFLRNGPSGTYVWFDPSELMQAEEDERIARRIADLLKAWKASGARDGQAVKQLLDTIDRTMHRQPDGKDKEASE